MIKLYDWQRRGLRKWRKTGKRGTIQAATGCLTGDTLIEKPRNLDKYPYGVPIENLVGMTNFYTYTFNKNKNMIELKKVKSVWCSGRKKVYEITFESGRKIKASSNHKFLIAFPNAFNLSNSIVRNYIKLKNLQIGMHVITFLRSNPRNKIKIDYSTTKCKSEHRFIMKELYGDKINKNTVHHIDGHHNNNKVKNLKILTAHKHSLLHSDETKYSKNSWKGANHQCEMKIKKHLKIINSNKTFDKIIGIRYIGVEKTYDMEVKDNHNFIANGIIVHNSGKTHIGLRVIEKYPDSTVLIVVNTISLLDQWYERIKQHLGIRVGRLGGAHHDLSCKILVAVVNSIRDVHTLKRDILILDECLDGSSLITLSDLTRVKIEDIVKNKNVSEVLSYNEKHNMFENKKIIRFIKQEMKDEWYELIVKTENGKEYCLRCTGNHKIYTNHGYVRTDKLKETDILMVFSNVNMKCPKCEDLIDVTHSLYNHDATIVSVKKIRNDVRQPKYKYNLEIEDNHNYIANNILVSNCHHYNSKENLKFIKHGMYGWILGLSATPKNEDENRNSVIEHYAPIIYEYNIKEAVEDDVVSKYSVNFIETQLTKMERARYDEVQKYINIKRPRVFNGFANLPPYLKKAYQERKSIANNAENKVKLAKAIIMKHYGQKVILFCESIKMADAIYETICDEYFCSIYHTKVKNRDLQLEIFRRGESKVLITVRALDEGVDCPETSVGLIVSSTKVDRQSIQRIGRILRKQEDKHAILYVLYSERTTEYYDAKKKELIYKDGASNIKWLKQTDILVGEKNDKA